MTGIDHDVAYELISSELLLDGQARLNLATFVTTWMPSIAGRLMAETADKNMIDKDEYPQTAEIESRCVNIIADLWNCARSRQATGCSTTGSSEAAMLAGMALKWRWRARMREAGKPTDRPNLVMGANVQVCWEKFCRYWEVEPRLVPMEGERYHLGPEEAVAQCDENTIGVVAILGSTFDGSYEPVKEIADALDRLEADKGLYVPLHVDAASGGFVAPFLQPDLEWDFCLPRVQSINASGHKYGLVYPGVGWAIWRDARGAPEGPDLRRQLPGRSHADVRAELLPPRERGHRPVLHVRVLRTRRVTARRCRACRTSRLTSRSGVADMGPYWLLSEGRDLPVFAFALKAEIKNYTVFDVSDRLRQRGWLVPAYTFPENRQDLSVLRVVIRAGMNMEMADMLLDHLREETEFLESLSSPLPGPATDTRQAFSH